MDLLPEEKVEINDTMKELNTHLQNVENVLNPLFELGSAQELANVLNPFEQAKFNIVAAYAINSLFFMYLKSQGVDPNTHAVKGELERVKLYIKKIKEITEKEKASLKVNVDAANRFIQHALSDAPTTTEPSTVTSPPSTSKSPGEKSKKNVPASNNVENKNRKKQRQ